MKKYIFKKIKDNIIYIIVMIISFFIVTTEIPFYIEKPGGIINITDRVEYDNKFKIKGSYNMAYVSGIKATIPLYIYAKTNKNWDLIPIVEEVGNGNEEELNYRNKLELNNSLNNAIVIAYDKADFDYKIYDNKIYVTYIYDEAKTTLKVKDQILEIDGKKIKDKEEIHKFIQNKEKDDILKIKVKRDKKNIITEAKIQEIEGIKIIGLYLTEDYKIKTKNKVNIKFKKSESGPSGGLMLSLAIYSKISKKDLTKGLKIAGTGTIDKDGNVGMISGVKYKLRGAVKEKADVFLVPVGNYKEALKEKKQNNYKIKIIKVETFDDAIEKLINL